MKSNPILVVEDDEDLRQLLETVLELHGIAAICVSNAAAAIQMMDERSVDAVLTDLNLSGDREGLEVLERGVAKGHPVVLMSAWVGCEQAVLLNSRTVRVLSKPFDVLALPGIIHEVRDV